MYEKVNRNRWKEERKEGRKEGWKEGVPRFSHTDTSNNDYVIIRAKNMCVRMWLLRTDLNFTVVFAFLFVHFKFIKTD